MTEKIKNALIKLANEILTQENVLDSEQIFDKIQKLYDVMTVFKFLKKNKLTDWEDQQHKLNLILNQIGDKPIEENTDNKNANLLEIEPLMETIRDNLTEIPENKNNESPFTFFSEPLTFVEKKSNNDEKEDQIIKKNINDQFSKGLQIDLNDKLAFIKQLFEEDELQYQRVISQITTLSDWIEVENFVNAIVKPEYDNWIGKDEFEKRFLKILRKNFT